jgi:transcriptional regulator NrdR family protein
VGSQLACPFCYGISSKVIVTRAQTWEVVRKRRCLACLESYVTVEKIAIDKKVGQGRRLTNDISAR